MQTLRPFIRPTIAASSGALLGYCVAKSLCARQKKIKDWDNFKKEMIPNRYQLLSVLAGIGTPVYFGLSTIPTIITSGIISGLGAWFFNGDNIKPVPKTSSSKSVYSSASNQKIDKIVNDFVPVFLLDFNSTDETIQENTNTNFPAITTGLTDNFSQNELTPQQKISIIEKIFTHFKNHDDKKFKNSQIWTSLLSTLSQQTDISNKEIVSLDVADGNNGEIKFEFQQLKEFMESLKAPQNEENVSIKDIKNLLNYMKPNQIYSKVLNEDNSHYYSFTIQKIEITNTQNTFNDYKISCFDSFSSKNYSVTQNARDAQNTLEKLIALNTQDKATESFCSDDMPFVFDTKYDKVIAELKLEQDDTFKPFSQASCTCHQMSVMNLFKYYIYVQDKQKTQ